MATAASTGFPQFSALLKNLSTGKIVSLVLVMSGVVTGFVLMMNWAAKPNLDLLYSNLSEKDAGAIVGRLRDQKIPYEISGNGTSILVPRDRIYDMRLELASDGLPQGSGVGFEVFDNAKLGMTEFVQNVNYQRALQGELARTINGFAEIESSRVHIVMPEKSLFIEEEEPPTASVVIKLRSGRRLGRDQVQGIVHLVSSSVSQLKPENVTVVDNFGKMLAGFKETSAGGRATSDQLEYQEKLELGLEQSVKTMLEKVLGQGKAIVKLSCSLDFTKYEKTEEIYDPEGRVIRSEQVFTTTSGERSNLAEVIPAAGIAGAAVRTEGVADAAVEGNKPLYQKEDRTINYEIGKVVSHTVEPVGKIKRISVAVIVDGTHKSVKGERGREKTEYFPRTQEEMVKLENLVKRAVNFDTERGDEVVVTNIPFERPLAGEGDAGMIEESWMTKLQPFQPVLKYVLLAGFVLFSFMFVARPLVRWLTSSSFSDIDMLKQLPMTVEEIERKYNGHGIKSLPYREKALEMLSRDKEGSINVMKDWLKQNNA
ncbi:MAG: flagellar M-ring protein FliF [Deltaproteobacteria bacterium]|nr:flagellar M-ring protein FliF [Deltaproteobacteria bacterium]